MSRLGVAPMLFRGISRHLHHRGFATISEFTLPDGRRADLFAIGRTGEIWIVEIKSSIEDFRADSKWPDYRRHCDRLFFATHDEMPLDIFPLSTGLILADAYDAEIIRDCPAEALAPGTRKALTIQMARLAASRLLALQDPDFRQL